MAGASTSDMRELGYSVDDLPHEEFLLINDTVEASGDFFLHHLLSTFVKADHRVCLVALGNSFEHFAAIGRKLGVNYQKAVGEQQFLHIDGYTTPYDWCRRDSATASDKFEITTSDEHDDLQTLYNRIQLFINNSKHSIIAIDDITSIMSTYGAQKTLLFVRYCRQLALEQQSILVILNHSDSERSETFFTPTLIDLATTVYQIRGLDSGYCKDVHGSVTITRRMFKLQPVLPKQSYQYKLVENGIRFIHSGIDP